MCGGDTAGDQLGRGAFCPQDLMEDFTTALFFMEEEAEPPIGKQSNNPPNDNGPRDGDSS